MDFDFSQMEMRIVAHMLNEIEEPCTECAATPGLYVGFMVTEPCRACQGTTKVKKPDPNWARQSEDRMHRGGVLHKAALDYVPALLTNESIVSRKMIFGNKGEKLKLMNERQPMHLTVMGPAEAQKTITVPAGTKYAPEFMVSTPAEADSYLKRLFSDYEGDVEINYTGSLDVAADIERDRLKLEWWTGGKVTLDSIRPNPSFNQREGDPVDVEIKFELDPAKIVRGVFVGVPNQPQKETHDKNPCREIDCGCDEA